MKKFLVWIERKSTFSGDSIPAHRLFLQGLREENLLFLAGGFPDQTGGAYVLLADSLDTATAIRNKDPMYVEGACTYQIKERNAQ
ncbi:YciI family protein [Brevibacillus centrosporus]|uniref:YciI family protein n=1 Tax=Brevibacillus centrosporus TaxID=54910 RepID=UPI002E1FB65B|nr:YciI family protein [Brevibacillus centrosporus]